MRVRTGRAGPWEHTRMRCGDRASILRHYQFAAAGERLDRESYRAVEQHLAGCESCARLARALAPLAAPLADTLSEPARRSADCPASEDLRGYLQRRLPTGARADVRQHLLHCDSCLRQTHLLLPAVQGRESGRLGGLAAAGRWAWAPTLASAALAAAVILAPRAKHTATVQIASSGGVSRNLTATSFEERPGRTSGRPVVTRRLTPPTAAETRIASAAPPAIHDSAAQLTRSTAPRGPHTMVVQRSNRGVVVVDGMRRIADPPEEVPDDANLLCVRSFDLAFPRDGGNPALPRVAARRLVAANELDEAAAILKNLPQVPAGNSPAVAAYLSLLYKAMPGRDGDARAALMSAVGEERGALTPDDDAIRIVRLAGSLMPSPADPALQELLGDTEGAKPAFEQLVLAAIVLDRGGRRDDSRAALRAAADWLELDNRLKGSQTTGGDPSSA